jgi:hypothetical protein
VDASPVGLGCVLTQINPENLGEKHIVSYASRLLSDTERRYSQIEKEALAVVWACEKNHLYLFGRKFSIVTDNKAVELILKNPRSKPPARIERWHLRLNQYNYKIKHKSGLSNIADFLSRQPVEDPLKASPADEYINYIEQNAVPKAMRLSEIIEASEKDATIQKLVEWIRENKHANDPEIRADERTVHGHEQWSSAKRQENSYTSWVTAEGDRSRTCRSSRRKQN